jgi:PAS domain-containing protein
MNFEEHDAALILDTESRVVYCGPAATALLGQHADSMTNRPVRAIFPALPLSLHTPGYNLAYVVIHGAQRHWMLHWAQTVRGDLMPLQILFSSMKKGKLLFIALQLRADQSHLQRLASAW